MESWLFLALVLVVALVGKNMSLIIATGAVMALKCQQVAASDSSQRYQLGRHRYFSGNLDSNCDRADWF